MIEPVETPILGSCCICRKHGLEVCNILMLDFRAPEAGTGWGCVVCHLPSDGAVAVLCDACLAALQKGRAAIQFVCAGYPGEDRRVAIDGFAHIPFAHRMEFHKTT